MHENYQPSHLDGTGDDGEKLREATIWLVEQGYSGAKIMEKVKDQPWIPLGWENGRIQSEIEGCGVRFEPKPAAKVAPIVVDDGIPKWLRERIESTAIPADPAENIREIVGALAGLGLNSYEIAVQITGRPWIPVLYAGSRLGLDKWAIPVAVAQARVIAQAKGSTVSRAPPNATQQCNAESNAAADDLRAVQRAIAAGRWRENSQAKDWAGHAVAAALTLEIEKDRAKIAALLKTWIASGVLVVIEAEDDQRKRRSFVEVGSGGRVTFAPPQVAQAAPLSGRCDDKR
jgi:hypothetical protein